MKLAFFAIILAVTAMYFVVTNSTRETEWLMYNSCLKQEKKVIPCNCFAKTVVKELGGDLYMPNFAISKITNDNHDGEQDGFVQKAITIAAAECEANIGIIDTILISSELVSQI